MLRALDLLSWCYYLPIGFGPFSWYLFSRFMNGVKDMEGYRMTLDLQYLPPPAPGNSSKSCDSQDDVETGAILVSVSIKMEGR